MPEQAIETAQDNTASGGQAEDSGPATLDFDAGTEANNDGAQDNHAADDANPEGDAGKEGEEASLVDFGKDEEKTEGEDSDADAKDGKEKEEGNEEKPFDKMTDEEKAAFVPKDPSGYKLNLPEGYTLDAESPILKEMHRLNLPNGTVEALVALDKQCEDARRESVKDSIAEVHKKWTGTLQKEWGEDTQANIRLTNKGAMFAGGKELVAALGDMGLSNYPPLVKAFCKIGAAMNGGSEDATVFNERGGGTNDVQRNISGEPMLNFKE